MRFCCRVSNDRGHTWCFVVENTNWHGLRAIAEKELAARVASDPLHAKYGPWRVGFIDVCA